MRITNQMLTNNMMSNINKNKFSMNKYDEQYSTGKKIQRPSDDPIVAVRALKLRTNLVQVNQYVDKNIPDALAWMDVSESALKNVNQLLTDMNSYCVDGANDDLTVDNRNSIIQNLLELRTQIYQEGNANYVGRYVFTGYKTDQSLTYSTADDLARQMYNITENFKGSDLESVTKVINSHAVPTTTANAATITDNVMPTTIDAYRLRLGYGSLGDKGDITCSLTYTKTDGTTGGTYDGLTAPNQILNSTDPGAYQVADNAINFLADTGEVIMGKDVYNALRNAKDIEVKYDKLEFSAGDLRPENFFECSTYKIDDNGNREKDTNGDYITDVKYKKENQKIEYEINFGQNIAVNVQARDAFSHDIGRDIEGLKALADDVTATEKKIAEVTKLRADGNNTEPVNEALDKLLEQLNTELVLKNSALQKGFGAAITSTQKQQQKLNIAIADLGSRYSRVELTEARLGKQKTDFTDLLSSNEDVDIAEAYINLSMAQMIYNCSLSAASKAVSNTLLDFI
ncbi:flagellin N-terminal helical domain-containing protein [Anaerosporobacter sp.]|uniref:flagellin N-terminal helical domain-containing protein n=1 Tax=Anaerosporobacter sp. TaxID=1872529 RepID=UPI00286F53F8|nr:flagellin [Anaerosporobacter sp.]